MTWAVAYYQCVKVGIPTRSESSNSTTFFYAFFKLYFLHQHINMLNNHTISKKE